MAKKDELESAILREKELATAQAERDEAMASRTRWQIALAESNQSVASLQNRLRDKHKELAAEKAMHNETRGELAYMTKLCQSEQEQLAKTTLNLSDSERDLAAAREALEHAEIFFRRILVAYDNPIPVDAKSSLWSDRADYMAKCARAGEERTRAALGKRGEG